MEVPKDIRLGARFGSTYTKDIRLESLEPLNVILYGKVCAGVINLRILR